MKVQLSFLICFCLYVSVRGQAGNANAFIDSILTAVKTEHAADLEPYHLPDEELVINQKVGIITIKGDVKLTKGTLTGLSKIHRNGDATVGTQAGHFAVDLKVGDEKVVLMYDAHIDLMNILHPNLKIEADIAAIDIKMSISLSDDGKPVISSFEIDELKHTTFKVTGLGILDPLVDVIADVVVEVANKQVRDALSKMVEPMIGGLLSDFKLPGSTA